MTMNQTEIATNDGTKLASSFYGDCTIVSQKIIDALCRQNLVVNCFITAENEASDYWFYLAKKKAGLGKKYYAVKK